MSDRSQFSSTAFFSVRELGWTTWADSLVKYGQGIGGPVAHVPLAAPIWLRILGRPLPFPFKRALASPRRYFAKIIGRHLDRLRAIRPLSVLVSSPQQFAPYLLDLCRRENIRLVVCLDTTGPIYRRELLRQPAIDPATWWEERKVYEAADLLVPWSNWAQTSLIEDFQIDPDKVLLTPPAVPIPNVSAHLGKSRLPRILFVGNDWQRKGGPRLVAWHQEHLADKAELHIVSAKAPRIRARNVISYGVVPRERLLGEVFPSMDLFCLPTSHDMSPFAISEAQAAGLPVVSSRLAGIPDLVADGDSGLLLDPANDRGFIEALTRLVSDEGLRGQMSLAARAHARAYLDADVVFPRLMARIASLVGRPAHCPTSTVTETPSPA